MDSYLKQYCSKEWIDFIEFHKSIYTLKKDTIVFNEGDDGDKMYIIKNGEVQVIRNNDVITILHTNAFFGEMALVSDEKRNATIKTITDVELLTIKKEDFKQLLESNSSIAEMVSYEVVKRANAIF